jgi:hypothetical protein
MTQGKRVALSAAQRTELWSRWKAGQSLHTIGRAFGKPHNSIHGFLSSRVTLNPTIWGHQKSGHSIQPRTNRSLRLFVPFWNVQGRVFRSTGLSIR